MVQGWESRAELANKRREEARARRRGRRGPQRLSGDAVLPLLLPLLSSSSSSSSSGAEDGSASAKSHFSKADQDNGTEAWVECEGKALCYSHFRGEACRQKRCKYSHEESVALKRGVEMKEDRLGKSENHMKRYSCLQDIPKEEYGMLHLVFLGGECIYDRWNALPWHQWYEKMNNKNKNKNKMPKNKSNNEALDPIIEADSVMNEDESVRSMDSEGSDVDIDADFSSLSLKMEKSPHNHCFLLDLPPLVLYDIIDFCSNIDLCWFYLTSKTVKQRIAANEELLAKRNSYLSSVSLSSKDLSKLRKKEKKKKVKQAHTKDNSKKGHKAVKVCRK